MLQRKDGSGHVPAFMQYQLRLDGMDAAARQVLAAFRGLSKGACFARRAEGEPHGFQLLQACRSRCG